MNRQNQVIRVEADSRIGYEQSSWTEFSGCTFWFLMIRWDFLQLGREDELCDRSSSQVSERTEPLCGSDGPASRLSGPTVAFTCLVVWNRKN